MTAILNINDNNLLLQIGPSLSRSQGYAWLKNSDVYFDFSDADNAVAACRLEPQQINSRYWQQCEQTALPDNDSGMRHAADLIWRHLLAIKQHHELKEVILVVPSHYQAANLQLLLGICQACELSVVGLLNKAVLAAHQHHQDEDSILHIDVQLHQTVCSEMMVAGSQWRLTQTEVLHEVGLQSMQDALLKAAQERFIQSDRFDPLHYAETEQQLFDQLPYIADAVRRDGKANINVAHGGKHYAASIDGRQWATALHNFNNTLEQTRGELRSPFRLYDFNGFEAMHFNGDDQQMVTQAELDVSGLLSLIIPDQNGKLIYQTSLPTQFTQNLTATEPPASSPRPVAPPKPEVRVNPGGATHLLHNGVAVPLSLAQLDIVQNSITLRTSQASNVADMLASKQLFVLGDEGRTTLQVNDRLGSNLSDQVLAVIRVE